MSGSGDTAFVSKEGGRNFTIITTFHRLHWLPFTDAKAEAQECGVICQMPLNSSVRIQTQV